MPCEQIKGPGWRERLFIAPLEGLAFQVSPTSFGERDSTAPACLPGTRGRGRRWGVGRKLNQLNINKMP